MQRLDVVAAAVLRVLDGRHDDMPIDKTLLRGLKEGQPAAYEWLAEEFEGPLYRFFLCDHRDHHLAEEQTAEVFAQLVRSLPTMKGGSEKLPAFVFAIARHVRSRRMRRASARHRSLADAHEVCDPRPSPSMQASNREQVQAVVDAISALEPDLRDVLLIRFVEGYSINDVARVLGMPVGTVKSHIHRGRARLKAVLANSEHLT